MAKFNQRSFDPSVTRNHEGEKAYKMPARDALYALACTSLVSDSFYEKENDRRLRMRGLVAECDPGFVARLAVYARKEMHLRSMPVMLAVELALAHRGEHVDGVVRKAVRGVVQRADDITELLSYYASFGGGKKRLDRIPQGVRKGVADVFESGRFDAYQYAKYDRDTAVKFRDAIFLCHPKPGDHNDLFKQIIDRDLPTPETWEVKQSAAGQKQYANEEEKKEAKRDTWERLIHEKKLGYMATMRNLRNFLDANIADEYRDAVCAYLSNEKAVLGSRVFPFRFWSAYREIEHIPGARPYMTALDQAARIMAAKSPFVKGRTLFAADVSGSMHGPLSEHSAVDRMEVGVVLGLLAMQANVESQGVIFGTEIATINFIGEMLLDKVDGILGESQRVGGATNGHLVPLAAIQIIDKTGKAYDKIVMFTDMQYWNSTTFSGRPGGYTEGYFEKAWMSYRSRVPEAQLVVVALDGYGMAPVRMDDKHVTFVAGWSERIFDMLAAMDEGDRAVDIISRYEI